MKRCQSTLPAAHGKLPITDPRPAAVYRLRDAGGKLLYIGCSTKPEARAETHRAYKAWGAAISAIEIEWFENLAEAILVERAAISSEMPEWNVHFRPNPRRSVGRLVYSYRRNDPATWAKADRRRVDVPLAPWITPRDGAAA